MFTRTVPAGEFPRFRRTVIRNGGAVVASVFCEGGFRVTYVSKVGAL